MANAHVVFGKVRSGVAMVGTNVQSQTVTAGNTSNGSNVEYNYTNITAQGGAIYVAVGTATPNAMFDPRFWIAPNNSIFLAIDGNTKVNVING